LLSGIRGRLRLAVDCAEIVAEKRRPSEAPKPLKDLPSSTISSFAESSGMGT
jgi:hypothetical protein